LSLDPSPLHSSLFLPTTAPIKKYLQNNKINCGCDKDNNTANSTEKISQFDKELHSGEGDCLYQEAIFEGDLPFT
jgi:hypothetical protein